MKHSYDSDSACKHLIRGNWKFQCKNMIINYSTECSELGCLLAFNRTTIEGNPSIFQLE